MPAVSSEDPPVLVTGGAGYIGSHAVLALQNAGYGVVVVDNLSNGVRAAVPPQIPLEVEDVGDPVAMRDVLQRYGCRDVLHFAGSVRVDESVENPLKYYGNNTAASRALIETCVACGIDRFVFSSTAAAYGIPDASPVTEDAPTRPINPYGWSKLMTEQMLRDTAATDAGMKIAILRYFNVAGADPDGRVGQRTKNATHLIKVACEVASGKRPYMQIFGTDYPTPDGTCIRDYIHVSDLADAHVAVLDYLDRAERNPVLFNCGYGRGYSVREVLAAVERAGGAPLPARDTGRRAGDPPELVSVAEAITREVGWTPRHADLDVIIRTALEWERSLERR